MEFGTCFDLADSAEVEYKACKLKTFFNFKSSVDNQESLACLPVVHPSCTRMPEREAPLESTGCLLPYQIRASGEISNYT